MDQREIDEIAAWLAQEKVCCFMLLFCYSHTHIHPYIFFAYILHLAFAFIIFSFVKLYKNICSYFFISHFYLIRSDHKVLKRFRCSTGNSDKARLPLTYLALLF